MNDLDSIVTCLDGLKFVYQGDDCADDCIECVVYGMIFTIQNTLVYLYSDS